jgi:hypothetical protein
MASQYIYPTVVGQLPYGGADVGVHPIEYSPGVRRTAMAAIGEDINDLSDDSFAYNTDSAPDQFIDPEVPGAASFPLSMMGLCGAAALYPYATVDRVVVSARLRSWPTARGGAPMFWFLMSGTWGYGQLGDAYQTMSLGGLNTTWQYFRRTYYTRPWDGAAWTADDVKGNPYDGGTSRRLSSVWPMLMRNVACSHFFVQVFDSPDPPPPEVNTNRNLMHLPFSPFSFQGRN